MKSLEKVESSPRYKDADGQRRCKKCRQRRHNKKYDNVRKELNRTPKYQKKRREWKLQNEYGLSLEAYDDMLNQQGGVCAVCQESNDGNLPVDHDHKTGQIRGLLCHRCNRVLGQLRDDPRLIHGLVSYLLRTSAKRSWDRYFMDIAQLAAVRSKDRSTQVGAVLIRDRNIISTGYNGFPRGVNDNLEERHQRPEKYLWTIHAEENAILNAARLGVSTEGATAYVTPLHPCSGCAKALIQSGITEVVFEQLLPNDRWVEETEKAKQLFQAAKVLVRHPE